MDWPQPLSQLRRLQCRSRGYCEFPQQHRDYRPSNIIGRVTLGGNTSNIYGTIQTTGFDVGGVQANLFLVNPSGFVFGPHGSFNVGGSVSFSTAQYLRLFDGVNSANFYADPAKRRPGRIVSSPWRLWSTLDFCRPAAYGFLDRAGSSATITVQGSDVVRAPGQSISLVGREVVLEGGAQLSASSGRIHLATTASPGEFAALPGESLANATSLQSVSNNPVDPASATSFTSYGLMSLAPGSSIDVSGANTVFVKGGQLVLSVNDATLTTLWEPCSARYDLSQPGQFDCDVEMRERILVLMYSSSPRTFSWMEPPFISTTMGSGRWREHLDHRAQTVNLINGAQIVSSTTGAGNGGNITISTTDTPTSSVTISGFDSDGTLSGFVNPFVGIVTSGVFSTASAGGNGGQISITAPTVTLDNLGTLATINSGDGDGGSISINSATVGLTNGASVLSSTGLDFITGLGGPGRGGDIVLTSGVVQLDLGANINSYTFGEGGGGNVTAKVGTLALANGAAINSFNFSSGQLEGQHGGDVTVQGLHGANSQADLVMLSQ